MVLNAALTIQTDQFAPGAEAGVDGKDVLAAEGGGHEKFAQVGGEDTDGFGVSLFFHLH